VQPGWGAQATGADDQHRGAGKFLLAGGTDLRQGQVARVTGGIDGEAGHALIVASPRRGGQAGPACLGLPPWKAPRIERACSRGGLRWSRAEAPGPARPLRGWAPRWGRRSWSPTSITRWPGRWPPASARPAPRRWRIVATWPMRIRSP